MDNNFIKDIGQTKITERIFKIFNFDKNKEILARDILMSYRNNFNPTPLLQKIKTLLSKKKPIFFGAGPNLEGNINYILCNPQDFNPKISMYVSADGASNALVNNNILPDVIFTDLDGLNLNQLEWFLENEVIIIIHAHGDNINKLENDSIKHLLNTEKNIIGTTQIEPNFPIINPGGFTDGDRSLFLCHHLAPKETTFILAGYEFGEYVGKYSKNTLEKVKMSPFKAKKMEFCKQLIDNLMEFRDISFI